MSGALVIPFTKRILRVGEEVTPGGPSYCGEPHPRRPDLPCGGYVGTPAVGAVLVRVLDAGEEVRQCQSQLWALRCAGCSRHHVYRMKSAA